MPLKHVKKAYKHPRQKIRLGFQLTFLLLAVYLFAGLIAGRFHSAHAFCPYATVCFGALQFSFAKNAVFLFSLTIGIGLLICTLTIFIGRKFCSYVCPIGTVQEFLFHLRSMQYRIKKRVPFFYEHKFRGIKYVILVLTLLLVVSGLSYIYMNFCPVLTISRLPSLIWPGLLLWVVILSGGLLTERFWCRFLCPFGALLNVFQYISKLFHCRHLILKRNIERCSGFCFCITNCPMNINLHESEYVIDINCIHCLKCITNCPKDKTIKEEKSPDEMD
jgi:polyferredoxin